MTVSLSFELSIAGLGIASGFRFIGQSQGPADKKARLWMTQTGFVARELPSGEVKGEYTPRQQTVNNLSESVPAGAANERNRRLSLAFSCLGELSFCRKAR
jgi:hypothetical protein